MILKGFLEDFRAVIFAVLVHLILLAMLLISLDWTPDPGSAEPQVDVVQAVAVDPRKVEAELERIRDSEARKRQQELERQDRLRDQAEQAREAREAEEQRLADAKRELADEQARADAERERLDRLRQEQDRLARERRAEEERLAQLETERKIAAERKRQAELDRQRLEEQKRVAEAERQRIQEENRKAEAERQRIQEENRKAEAERQRIEEEKRKAEAERQRIEQEKRKAEAERKRIQEENRRAEAERRRIQEEQRRKRAELAMQAELAQEEQILRRRRQTLRMRHFNEYVGSIKEKVQRHWRRPVGVPAGLSVKIRVAQIPGGDVVSATVTQSSGNVEFDRSVEAAVFKASPLPRPRDPDLFEREIVFIFEPED